MSYESKCSQCGGTDLEPGSIQSTGKIYFRPANAKFLTLSSGDVNLNANVCLDCGNVELVADVTKLSLLTARAKPF